MKAISIALCIMGLAACAPTVNFDSIRTADSAESGLPLTTTVRLTAGEIRGRERDAGLKEFLGIPYAAAPTGVRRWQPPHALAPWDGVKDASAKGLPCMQPASLSPFYDRGYPEMSEDCLTLNVWTRAATDGDKLPVMVWIHGGALIMGSGADYDGAALSARGVVLITINYRLGPFGFFAHPALSAESRNDVSGNQGYKDQIAALQWVQEHIGAFGGDPDNVTIFGESAGSWSMSVLQGSPAARGLFHKVIGQSGARFIPLSDLKVAQNGYTSAEQRGVALAKVFADQQVPTLTQLRALPAKKILSAYAEDPAILNDFDSLTVIDGDLLPADLNRIYANGEQADVPVMIGSNALEASTFDPAMFAPKGTSEVNYSTLLRAQVDQLLPDADPDLQDYYPTTDETAARQSWINFNTDAMFTQPMNLWAEHMLKKNNPAYLYWWNWQPTIAGSRQYGAFHAAEVAYVFNELSMFEIDATAEDQAFSGVMMDIWTQFAKTGNPTVPGVLEWPAYTADGHETAIIGRQIGMADGIRLRQSELITEAFNKRRE